MALLSLTVFALLRLISTAEGTTKVSYISEIPASPEDVFPSCVEVVNVWPTPNSVLRQSAGSIMPDDGSHWLQRYIFRITFSRPVSITKTDTSAGRYHQHKHILRKNYYKAYHRKRNWALDTSSIAPLFLSPSTSFSNPYYPFRTINYRGSNTTFVALFAIPRRGFPQIE